MKHFSLLFAFIALFVASCSKEDRQTMPDETIPVENLAPRKDIVLTKSQAEYVKTGGNEFALNLFRQLAGENGFVISPLSVTFGLGMADNGAAGNTRAQIDNALGYEEDSVDGLNAYCKAMMSSVREIDPSVAIEFANTAVVNSARGSVRDEFKKAIENNYFAGVCNKDFGSDDVMGYINSWCSANTQGRIPTLLTQQPTETDFAHLLNAVYFKGIWSSQFKRKDSRSEDMRDIYGNKHKVNMMHQEGHFNYASVPGIGAALSLPFGNQAYSMLFLLPENGNIFDLHKALDIKAWNTVTSELHDEKVDVKIPSFELSFETDLRENLQQLGIVDAFHPLAADFQLMSETMTYISAVLHKATISIDEQGSEAAAVTDVIFGGYSSNGVVVERPSIEFHADRPFIYAITEVSTGAIVFIGQYTGK